ncbi:PucR family transcriptional regulator [Mycobacterium intermedium]|uniref:PucR family transcriptional regulator n=2 Tax=Mycobacterium intermedium TaxID=28445 RepID=UPI0039ECBA32
MGGRKQTPGEQFGRNTVRIATGGVWGECAVVGRRRAERSRHSQPSIERGVAQDGHFNMDGESPSPSGPSWQGRQASSERLAVLSRVAFDDCNIGEIFQELKAAVGDLSSCQVEASFRFVDGGFLRFPPSQPQHPEIERHLRQSGCGVQVDVQGGPWGWALALGHLGIVHGCLVLSAVSAPPENQMILLTILAQQAGAALAHVALHERNIGYAGQLAQANGDLEETIRELATAVSRLRLRTKMHEVLSAAMTAGMGEQGIVDALYDLTGLSVGLEDRFGNLRCWAGPGEPRPYPEQTTDERGLLLHELAAQNRPARLGGRLLALVQSRAEILGVLALQDPDDKATEDSLFVLGIATPVLALELLHKRNLAEAELNLRRELVDDLLAGTDRDGAYARAEALGHNLRRPHYVVAVQAAGCAESAVATAVVRAATSLNLNYLQGRHSGLVVLLTEGRPDPRALHHAISERLDRTTSVIGVGTRCEVPDDLPQSFVDARRALNIRLRSANPEGAAAFDELGFYRLIDAAHGDGTVEAFVREWLGTLLDYDESRNSQLVLTLSDYLECGGNYDESATALHIHRSTLRYRLARIAELTGHDLREVDTRFNLTTPRHGRGDSSTPMADRQPQATDV